LFPNQGRQQHTFLLPLEMKRYPHFLKVALTFRSIFSLTRRKHPSVLLSISLIWRYCSYLSHQDNFLLKWYPIWIQQYLAVGFLMGSPYRFPGRVGAILSPTLPVNYYA
jgi:hypothetical protein